HSGRQIGDRYASAKRSAVGLPGNAHESAHSLGDEVVTAAIGVRTLLAETGDRTIDEAWIDRLQAVVVEPVFLQAANLEILDQDVGFRGEPADQLSTFLARQIDRRRTLVAVAGEIIGAFERVV